MRLRARSLWIDAHMMASWSAPARIRAAELLVGRWLGGRIRLVDDRGPAAWFHLGLARDVARRMLVDPGLLDRFEYAEDLDAIEAILATLPPAAPNAGPSDPASLRRALSLGSTYAAHLEADLRSRDGHPFGLRDRLRQFLLDNATTRDVSVSTWHHAVGDAGLQHLLTDAGPKRLPKHLRGPVFRPTPHAVPLLRPRGPKSTPSPTRAACNEKRRPSSEEPPPCFTPCATDYSRPMASFSEHSTMSPSLL